jgi:hypothetical protein
MRRISLVSVVTIVAFLATGTVPAYAQRNVGAPAGEPTTLRASVDREAAKAATQVVLPGRQKTTVRRKMMQGGGGGGGMIVMTLIGTVAGLATTYFVVKEMRKQNEQLTTQPQ